MKTPLWLRPFTSRPYPPREAVGVLWRNLVGPSFANPTGLAWGPQHLALNDITPALTLGFGGDVMSMFDKPLVVDEAVHAFFAACDHVVLNFEGVITDAPQIAPDQKHTPRILDDLQALAPAERLVLSLANNHTGDYGEAACQACMALLSHRGFRHFGVRNSPIHDLHPMVRLITGTEWSNREGRHLAWLTEPGSLVKPGALNIGFPHWGYELEAYPRASLVQRAAQWLEQVDAIVAHHCHMPQPLQVVAPSAGSPGVKKLVAYSLGDLCFGLASDRPFFWPYQWGSVLRMTVGPLKAQPERWAIGTADWRFVHCGPVASGQAQRLSLHDRCALTSLTPLKPRRAWAARA